jgi:hypothetical protein
MYAGSTFTPLSGKILGAHQKIDRAARHQLEQLMPQCNFPPLKMILHFEGDNGPDAIKRKSPAENEPWHYIQPFDRNDVGLIELIEEHHRQLVKALKQKDNVRAAFEAAWLAHAIVDGLTPAHHYPYEEKLVELSSGRSIADRTSISKKIVMPGETRTKQVSNNWKMWGPKGLFVTHTAFEWGVAVLILPLKLRRAVLHSQAIAELDRLNLGEWFRQTAQKVATLGLYDEFYKCGWNVPIAKRVRTQLAPALVEAVTLAWYDAARQAEETS